MLKILDTTELSQPERKLTFDVIDSIANIRCVDEFFDFSTKALQHFIPHEILICGVGTFEENNVHVQKILSRNCPPGYFDQIRRNDCGIDSPILRRFLSSAKPVLFEADHSTFDVDPIWLANFNHYQFKNIASYGVLDLQGTASSHFSFIRIPQTLGPRHELMLQLLVPYLHGALVRAIMSQDERKNMSPFVDCLLSARQKEILFLMSLGNSNAEIAQKLVLTQKNIKYHINQIFTKLNSRNRTQAVAKARDLGII